MKFYIPVLSAFLWILCSSGAFANQISGRTWEDLNVNGIQDDLDESSLTNVLVQLTDANSTFLADVFSDANGNYNFSGLADGNYIVWFFEPDGYAITAPNAGSDDTKDSDSTEGGNTGVIAISGGNPLTHVDAGFYKLSAGISLSIRVNAYSSMPAYVTNGAWVTVTYIVTNTGNVSLSSVTVFDMDIEDIVGTLDCPAQLAPGTVFSVSRSFQVWSDKQFDTEAFGFAVDYKTCDQITAFPEFDVAGNSVEIVVFSDEGDSDEDGLPNGWEMQYGLNPSVSNTPSSNSDTDWMTDFQEFIADTNPQDPLSFFPLAIYSNNVPGQIVKIAINSTSPDRVYHVSWSTNLLEQPRHWVLLPPEIPGNGSVVDFSLTNAGYYRTGVRLKQ